ncbi:hypothetical protein G3480_21665 [Thiorhodococcus mannitoliphagus]|uniref:N-acetyl sugar amidotransferase n=1 Tax=Thiorhodococcus mannitoliphagus TaxID=329406 RepID=A0A6P1DX40_9GAMM|nr:hypothetical protein [Thiorhodococcus mannitoliphagus]NEX22877.1 hypothetical protein [Thiorhodococcus mannitoliphagus]
MARCKSCLIPDAVPGVTLSPDGLCNLCADDRWASNTTAEEAARELRQADLERTLDAVRGQADYDCLVPLSGGKDSLYLLHRLKHDYGLKVLAFTVDVNIPDLAWDSIRRALAKLEIDHFVYRPPPSFYHKLFRYLLMHQEARGAVYTVSYVYAPLFEGDALQLAMAKGIPLVLAGYSPGQPEPERMLYEFSRTLIEQVDWTPPELRASGVFAEDELNRFYNPARYPAGTQFPRYLAPFHAWPYNQEEIMRRVVELGLVATRKHANPIHSNYPINWLLMYSDLRHFGYNPYVPEFSALIRRGKANRNYWRVMAPLVDFLILNRLGPGREVTRSLRELGLSAEDLRIDKPRGAYDPILTD